MQQMFDLHTHSTASDGSYHPENLVSHAAAAGITHLGLTDHDTVAGLDEAYAASQRIGITLVNGIELSSQWGNKTLHIIGLGIDPANKPLGQAILGAQSVRVERGCQIGAKLEQAGITRAYDGTCEVAGSTLVGRAHFARYLIAQGYAKDFKQVFKRYMVRGKPGYVMVNWMEMQLAIELIQQAGGMAVLAHPLRYHLSSGKRRTMIEAFAGAGGNAIEVVAGRATSAEIDTVARLANQFGLLASVGSDFHGPDKPWQQLGKLAELPRTCRALWREGEINYRSSE